MSQLEDSLANLTKTIKAPMISNQLLDFINLYVCSFLVFIGVIGNSISMLIFARSNRFAPKILTRTSLILLTISNIMYLTLLWYYKVFRIVDSIRFLSVDSNAYACKSVLYLIGLAITLNSLITCSFSLERAFAINYPLKARNLRASHPLLYQCLFVLILMFSFLFPSYNLFLVELKPAPDSPTETKCDVDTSNSFLYLKMTFIFVLVTTAIPFVLIFISNISIIYTICRKRWLFHECKTKNSEKCQSEMHYHYRRIAFKNTKSNAEFDLDLLSTRNTQSTSTEMMSRVNTATDLTRLAENNSPQKTSSPWSSIKSGRHSTNLFEMRPTTGYNSSKSYVQNVFKKNMFITKMLITISVSFVILHFPYLITYAINVQYILSQSPAQAPHELFRIQQLTEILNLLNYSIAGFLYFASGRMFREHLYAMFKCTYFSAN